MKKRFPYILFVFFIFFISLFVMNRAGIIPTLGSEKKVYTVVIDVGHGGIDPGKVGVNDVLEKDVNLVIALKLKSILEANDCNVILTRESDVGLYDETASNKKVSDLNNRIACIISQEADFVVSIHQNSYSSEQEHGAQVFYYTGSSEGKLLAEEIQESLISYADPDNTRQAKANSDYFILKNSPCPIVIVECGFLSNWEEANLLATEEYQEKIAFSIAMGCSKYMNAQK